MKRFLYSRLKARDRDYNFYIPPAHPVGPLADAIASDLISSRTKLLFLQNRNGVVTFGVRERLDLRDDFGRPLCSFMGFQARDCGAVPSFRDLRDRLEDITAESHACHELLNEDPACGPALQDSPVSFGAGGAPGDNDWDRALSGIRDNPGRPVFLMCDEQGRSMDMQGRSMDMMAPPSPARQSFDDASGGASGRDRPARLAASRREDRRAAAPPEEMPPESRGKEADQNAPPPGISSGAALRPEERAYVPPLPEAPERPQRGFLGINWERLNFFSRKEPPEARDRPRGRFPGPGF